MLIFKRAFRDTFTGQGKSIAILLIGGILSIVYLYLTKGKAMAFDEIPYVYGALFGSFGALFLLFVWNLICAPYRMMKDRVIDLEDAFNGDLRPKPDITLKSIMPKLLEVFGTHENVCQKLSDFAGSGQITVWSRMSGIGPFMTSIDATKEEVEEQIIDSVDQAYSSSRIKLHSLQELPSDYWKNHYISEKIELSQHAVNLIDNGYNCIAINSFVGLGSMSYDIHLSNLEIQKILKA